MRAEARPLPSAVVSSAGTPEVSVGLGVSTTLPIASRPPGAGAVLAITNEIVWPLAGATVNSKVADPSPRPSGTMLARASCIDSFPPQMVTSNAVPFVSSDTASVTDAAHFPGGSPIQGPPTRGPGASPISIATPAWLAGSPARENSLRSQTIWPSPSPRSHPT